MANWSGASTVPRPRKGASSRPETAGGSPAKQRRVYPNGEGKFRLRPKAYGRNPGPKSSRPIFAEELCRFFRWGGVDVKACAPFETGTSREPGHHLKMPVIVVGAGFHQGRRVDHQIV